MPVPSYLLAEAGSPGSLKSLWALLALSTKVSRFKWVTAIQTVNQVWREDLADIV